MNKIQKRTHRLESLPLLSLKVALTHARKDVPPQMEIPRKDVDEEQALQLIRMMKLQFKRQAHPVHWINSLAPLGNLHKETVVPDVR